MTASHHYHFHIGHDGGHGDPGAANASQLDIVIDLLHDIRRRLRTMSQAITDLQATDVALGAKMDAATTVMSDAGTTITDLAQKLSDALASNNPAAIQAVIDDLNTHGNNLTTASDALTQALATARGNATPAAPATI